MNRFEYRIERLNAGRTRRVTIRRAREPLRYADVLELWMQDDDFCIFFSQLLIDVPFDAYFWETPPLSRASRNQAFECVLVDSPELAGVIADRRAFAEHFSAAGDNDLVVSFPNLGQDALLIAPMPGGHPEGYPHLAAFLRSAPQSRQRALWQAAATAVAERLSDRPLWLSTSGLGVYWVHLRLDSRPKYYSYNPYTAF